MIAVVGDTGSGKSSLINALIGHRCILPTSGIRACTSVAIEIEENSDSNKFEADIKFLSKQVNFWIFIGYNSSVRLLVNVQKAYFEVRPY